MTKISPEYRDMDEMERWYKKLGDDYALWLIEQVRDLRESIEAEEERQNDECIELDDRLSMFTKAVDRIIDKLDSYLDDSETMPDDDSTALTEYVEELREAMNDADP